MVAQPVFFAQFEFAFEMRGGAISQPMIDIIGTRFARRGAQQTFADCVESVRNHGPKMLRDNMDGIIHKHCWIIGLSMMILSACQTDNIDYDNLDVKEVSLNGFYAYILPASTVEIMGWTQTITMTGFDTHCSQSDTIYRENPIWITYQDGRSQAPFAVAIAPTASHTWNFSRSVDTITVAANFIEDEQVEYYEIEDSEHLLFRFEDDIGMQVVVLTSQDKLGIEQSISLIRQLLYSGPNETSIGNPWEKVCK